MIGKKYGRWTVLKKIPKYNQQYGYYLCQCDCGTIKPVRKNHLINNGSISCGCFIVDKRRENCKAHIGEKHGNWTIIDIDANEKTKFFYIVRCKCGVVKNINYASLSSGRSSSCGCYKKEIDSKELRRLKSMTDASREKFLYKGTNIANIRSSSISFRTKSGIKGVYKRENGKWIARLGFKGKIIHLGTFNSVEEAIDARLEGERKYYEPIIAEHYEVNKNI